MRGPIVAALTTIVTVLAVVTAACGSDSEPSATVTITPASPTPASPTPAGPAVTFKTASGETFRLTVEIADTPEERAVGLMNRESLPEDAGMLFVWPEDTGSGFWMKNTLIPLSIAFIDAAGVIVDIRDMQPQDETLHYSPSPYRHAVEANQGWFAERRIEPGDTVDLPAAAG